MRTYGDDREIYDSRYRGVPCQPWVLNEKFFRGAGSIIVGISRKQRNIFDIVFPNDAEIESPTSLYAAFNPADERQNFVALSASRAAWSPRTGNGRADGADSLNARANPPRRYEVRYDSVLDRKLGPEGHPVLPDAPGLDQGMKRNLEENGRIGCVCGTPNTTARLRHQWNLSQTDWDAVLLPLRHAHARHDAWDSAAPLWRGQGPDSKSDWGFFPYGGLYDSVSSVVGSLLWDKAVWRSFDSKSDNWFDFWLSNDNSLPTKRILPLPDDLDESTPTDLFRKRRIL